MQVDTFVRPVNTGLLVTQKVVVEQKQLYKVIMLFNNSEEFKRAKALLDVDSENTNVIFKGPDLLF